MAARLKYRIKSPTIALFQEDDRHVAHTVPAGAIVTVDPETFNGNKLVYVTWKGEQVMMFAQDLRLRGEELSEIKREAS